MQKIMLIGEIGSGKSTLINTLTNKSYQSSKAMSIDYYDRFINTPGEFLENRRFYLALITTSAECDVLLFLQSANSKSSLYPPGFVSAFNKKVIGVITKTDLPDADISTAEVFLNNAGVNDIVAVNCKDSSSLLILTNKLNF